MDDTQINYLNKEIGIVRKRKKMKDRETGNKRKMGRNPQGLRWSTQRKRETERYMKIQRKNMVGWTEVKMRSARNGKMAG